MKAFIAVALVLLIAVTTGCRKADSLPSYEENDDSFVFDAETTAVEEDVLVMYSDAFIVPTSITIGHYEIEMDSVGTMTKEELVDFGLLIVILSRLSFMDGDIVDVITRKMLPARMLKIAR